MPFRWLLAGRWSRLVIVVVAGTAAALLMLDGSARAQQRDPFDPLVSPGATATDDTGVTGTSVEGAGDTTDTAPAPSVEESSLPSTGPGVTGWLAVAYVLVAIGASLILLTKTLQRDG